MRLTFRSVVTVTLAVDRFMNLLTQSVAITKLKRKWFTLLFPRVFSFSLVTCPAPPNLKPAPTPTLAVGEEGNNITIVYSTPMTTRPLRQGSTKRPVSAIFLGSNSSSSSFVPDLPEPPSPGASSNDSGLPSPPATNSTGSGSVGDSAGSVRRKPTMFNGTNNHARTVSASSALDDVQDENEILDDEEHTAKFGGPGRRYSTSNAPADNLSALERVKSLAKRNQEVRSLFFLYEICAHHYPYRLSKNSTGWVLRRRSTDALRASYLVHQLLLSELLLSHPASERLQALKLNVKAIIPMSRNGLPLLPRYRKGI